MIMTIYEYDIYFRETYIDRSFEVRRCEGYVLRGLGYHQILVEWLNAPKLNFNKDGVHIKSLKKLSSKEIKKIQGFYKNENLQTFNK